jgi:hypothetical protein
MKISSRWTMLYRCPICKLAFLYNRILAEHIADNGVHNINHRGWIESHGITFRELINPKRIITRGDYQPLIDIIENECRYNID